MLGEYYKRGIFRYKWERGILAQELNQDHELIRMLVEAKAPHIRIQGDRIHVEKSLTTGNSLQLPTEELLHCIDGKLLHCIDGIADHMCKQ